MKNVIWGLLAISAVVFFVQDHTHHSHASKTPRTKVAALPSGPVSRPVSCLRRASVTDVRAIAGNKAFGEVPSWTGDYTDGLSTFFGVSVNKFPTAAKAKAWYGPGIPGSYGALAGSYTVMGPATPAGGSTMTADQGSLAEEIVADIAACLS